MFACLLSFAGPSSEGLAGCLVSERLSSMARNASTSVTSLCVLDIFRILCNGENKSLKLTGVFAIEENLAFWKVFTFRL